MKNYNLRPVLLVLLLAAFSTSAAQTLWAAQQAPIVGEVQYIFINDLNDIWSGGIIVVGGQNVIIPKNLLIDLPANRLTLQQLFTDAPLECLALGETGLAKADSCNTRATGAIVSILANITASGNNIAGDVFMPKAGEVLLGAGESVLGNVTFIDYTDGYLRVNGDPADPVPILEPWSASTIPQGALRSNRA